MAASKKTFPCSRLRYPRSRKNGSTDSRKPHSKSSLENSSSVRNRFYPPYFTVDDLAIYRRKKIPEKQPPDTLRPLSGKFGHLKSEYKKKFRSFVIAPEESGHVFMNWKKKKMKAIENLKLEDEIDLSSRVPVALRKPKPFKPVDHLEPDPVTFATSTENKDRFVMFKEARRAVLARHPTTLKVDGEFEDSTETKAKYKEPLVTGRPGMLRRNTTLRMNGDFDFLTETTDKYKEFENVQRAKLIRRSSSLEMPSGKLDDSTEYNREFRAPEHPEQRQLIRSMENLHSEGDMEFEPEYNRSFVDYHAGYPDVKFKTRKKEADGQLCGTMDEKFSKYCRVQDAARLDLSPKLDCRPEYRHSFVRFQPRRPIFKRPRTNLSPPLGIGEKESELNAKYKPFEVGQRTKNLRPATHLRPEGGVDFTPEYRKSFVNFADCERERPSTEKSFDILELGPGPAHVNASLESKPNRSADVRFQKGRRLPANANRADKAADCETLILGSKGIAASQKPSFRLEVTNPDQVQKPFERRADVQPPPFVVLDENNNNEDSSKWVKSKQSKRWSPSWAKGY